MLLDAVAIAGRHSQSTVFRDVGDPTMSGDSDVKSALRKRQQDWLRQITARTGLSPSDLAEKAGMSDVTLTRLLNSESYTGTLSSLNIEKIKRFTGLPGPEEALAPARPSGEGQPFQPRAERSPHDRAVEATLDGRAGAKAWELLTDALRTLGLLPGDIVIADAAERAKAGDLVAAQLTDPKTGEAEVVFRVLEPPYLIGVANDPATRTPIPINDTTAIVIGPVTEMLRVRRAGR